MNDDVVDDLKQFIATTVRQETAAGVRDQLSGIHEELSSMHEELSDTRSELLAEIRNVEKRLTTRIDDLERSVADSLDTTNETTDAQLQDHEQRIKLLEQKAAA